MLDWEPETSIRRDPRDPNNGQGEMDGMLSRDEAGPLRDYNAQLGKRNMYDSSPANFFQDMILSYHPQKMLPTDSKGASLINSPSIAYSHDDLAHK